MWSYVRATIWMAVIAAAVTAGYHYGTALDPLEQSKLGEKCVRDARILQTNRRGPQQITRVHASKFFIDRSVEIFLINRRDNSLSDVYCKYRRNSLTALYVDGNYIELSEGWQVLSGDD